ncbi:unnamed protein product [Diamesa hyperborea]
MDESSTSRSSDTSVKELKFPITVHQICGTDPKFPYRDIIHYTDPCCHVKKVCQMGYTAQQSLNESLEHKKVNQLSPELPTSHPWFDPNPQKWSTR